jgi:3alpha(or 20beta)-hydroxysteroid dehydrogenase
MFSGSGVLRREQARRAEVHQEGTDMTADAGPRDGTEYAAAARGRLAGRIAAVSGGAGGIGRATAHLFVTEGACVLVADLPESQGKTVAEALGPRADFYPLDVRNHGGWLGAVSFARERFGAPPDVLVHTAGVMTPGQVATVAADAVTRTYEVNVLGTLNAIQAVVPGMRSHGRGSIVVITSMAGVTFGVPGMAPYAASKAAAGALVQCAAIELGHDGIRVNSIVPGQVDTPMSRNASGAPDESYFARMPIPRVGQPRDIAQAAVFLASDESAWVTGTHLLVDGGMDAGPSLS